MNFFNKKFEPKTWFSKITHRIIFNNIYRICFFIVILIIGSLIPTDWSYYIWLTGAIGLSIHVLIFIVYAWIINPIRSIRDKNI